MQGAEPWNAARERLSTRSPREILEWTLGAFPGRTIVSVSFGGGGLVLAHLVSTIDRTVPIVFLDTGFHFPETLEFRDAFVARFGLSLVTLYPAEEPGPLYA